MTRFTGLGLAWVLALASSLTLAQNYQGMSEADMQRMMQEMQKIQACVAGIDQQQLKDLEQRGRAMEAEIKTLCADGKRAKAEKTALAFGLEMSQHPVLKQMRGCRGQAPTMMSNMMPKIPYTDRDKETSKRHVCDE